MNIFSKQRNFINRKAIFFIATQNKNETVALSAKDKISKGHNNNELSRSDNIANNASNVNNTGTKFSLDVGRFQINFKKTKGQAGLCELLFR